MGNAVLSRNLGGLKINELFSSSGLDGQKMMMKVNTKELFDCYPFAQYEIAVPIRVVKDYTYFLDCEVLPHLSPNPMRFGESTPYRVSIHKFCLRNGEIDLRPMSN